MDPDPMASLSNAYRNSLQVAKENNIQYIAFPSISCVIYRYPYDEIATVAISTVKEFADGPKELLFFVLLELLLVYNFDLLRRQLSPSKSWQLQFSGYIGKDFGIWNSSYCACIE